MPECRRASLRAGLAAACLVVAAGSSCGQTVTATPVSEAGPSLRLGDDFHGDAGKVRIRSSLQADAARIRREACRPWRPTSEPARVSAPGARALPIWVKWCAAMAET